MRDISAQICRMQQELEKLCAAEGNPWLKQNQCGVASEIGEISQQLEQVASWHDRVMWLTKHYTRYQREAVQLFDKGWTIKFTPQWSYGEGSWELYWGGSHVAPIGGTLRLNDLFLDAGYGKGKKLPLMLCLLDLCIKEGECQSPHAVWARDVVRRTDEKFQNFIQKEEMEDYVVGGMAFGGVHTINYRVIPDSNTLVIRGGNTLAIPQGLWKEFTATFRSDKILPWERVIRRWYGHR